MKKNILSLTLCAMFLAIGLALPFLTSQVPTIGKMLLPMHIPVILCGFICGWKYGLAIGLILAPLRSLIFGAPAIYPDAVVMLFELAAYGAFSGLIYSRLRLKNNLVRIYLSLITAMLFGRIVWAAAKIIILGFGDKPFTWDMFMAGAFINAFPGIILQLILIPAIITALYRTSDV